MATKSFFKNIYLKDIKSANAFVSTLENAENKGRKQVNINTTVKTIKDKGIIKQMFGE